MNGHIIPGTPIAVDFWKKRDCPSAKFFFLTHLHGDHTVGLSSSWQYNIYCSEITSKLLIEKFGVKEELVNSLEIGSSNIIYMDEEKQEQLVVSVICANHCPGSVMFLFEGYFGKVLYTGDFRYCESMFIDTPLSNCSNIEVLYLDNTYCAPECIFPTREDAIDSIISLIKQHPEHRIIIGMRNLGKESLLVKIAEETKEWISVPSSVYRTAEILGLPNVFCLDDMDCKIRVVPFHTVTRKNALEWDDFEPTLVILPSALYTGLDSTPYQDTPNIHVVPYSDHSSYEEICSFVKKVKPKFIQPIVTERPRGGIFGKFADRSDMSRLQKFLSNELSVKFSIPPSVKKFMSLPMIAYIRKVLKQKKQRRPLLHVKKRSSVMLGVVYESPRKSELNDSCKEFETNLEKIRASFQKESRNVSDVENYDTAVGYEEFEQNLLRSSTQAIEENLQEDQSNLNNLQRSSSLNSSAMSNNSQIVNEENVDELCRSSKHIENSKNDKIYLTDKEKSNTTSTTCTSHPSLQNVASPNTISTQYSTNSKQKSLDKWVKRSPIIIKADVQSSKKSSRKLELNSLQDSISDTESNCLLPNEIGCINDSCKVYDLHFLYDNNIPASKKLKLFPLKPLSMKRSASVSSDLCILPIKPLNIDACTLQSCENIDRVYKGKRNASEDISIIPLKKARSVC